MAVISAPLDELVQVIRLTDLCSDCITIKRNCKKGLESTQKQNGFIQRANKPGAPII
jgi:hypothetical protein